jgi:hypothetical protein
VKWKLAPPTDESKFPRGWHLYHGDQHLGSVVGEYVPTEPVHGDVIVVWRWRLSSGRTSNTTFTDELAAQDALEALLARQQAPPRGPL